MRIQSRCLIDADVPGCWFVLERWIADYPFQGAASPGKSDHDIARGPNGRSILEAHWDAWVREDDWKWIAERGLNAVRIPVRRVHDLLRSLQRCL